MCLAEVAVQAEEASGRRLLQDGSPLQSAEVILFTVMHAELSPPNVFK